MKKIFLTLLIVVTLFLTGCNNKKENTNENGNNNETKRRTHEIANTDIGYIQFYVPWDFDYKPELRGLMYNENERKIYTKYDKDTIYIDAYIESYEGSVEKYIEEVNSKLTSKDVAYKFIYFNTTEIYGRENYSSTKNGVEMLNFSYVCNVGGYSHIISIWGPKSKSSEIQEISKDVLLSIVKM